MEEPSPIAFAFENRPSGVSVRTMSDSGNSETGGGRHQATRRPSSGLATSLATVTKVVQWTTSFLLENLEGMTRMPETRPADPLVRRAALARPVNYPEYSLRLEIVH